MNILYAIQGTGNGHLSRARDIVPLLHRMGNLDILISGTQGDIDLPYPVAYRFKGLSFIFGKKGGVDLAATYRKSNLRRLLKEIDSLQVEKYDLVISDFEPVSSWACYVRNKPCISLSHQSAILSKHAPMPKRIDPVGKAILKYYAPATEYYGFHFREYDEHIYTPVIRRQVRELHAENKGHYTIYLPAYDDERIIKVLKQCSRVPWQVFSKHTKKAWTDGDIAITPVNNEAFLYSMAGAAGVICGAGFETPAEAMFLGKKLIVIPMKGQFEQHCNAAALHQMGIPVLKSFKKKHCEKIDEWIRSGVQLTVDFPDITAQILEELIGKHPAGNAQLQKPIENKEYTLKDLKKASFKKIMAYVAG